MILPPFTPIKPMKPYDLTQEEFESLTLPDIHKRAYEPKVDGIRCLVFRPDNWTAAHGWVVQSASGKPIPNAHIRRELSRLMEKIKATADSTDTPIEIRQFLWQICSYGLDFELTVGSVFQESSSGVMTKAGRPDFTAHLLDMMDPIRGHKVRRHVLFSSLSYLQDWGVSDSSFHWLRLIPSTHVWELAMRVKYKFPTDGIIVRNWYQPYLFGRSTPKDSSLARFKPRKSEEARIVGFIEGETNLNPPTLDRFGLTKRSASQAGKVPSGTLGAFVVESPTFSKPFQIGTGEGLTKELRQRIWDSRNSYLGDLVTYDYLEEGSTPEAPRQPIWRGFRNQADLTGY